jgi:hypothetical protein
LLGFRYLKSHKPIYLLSFAFIPTTEDRRVFCSELIKLLNELKGDPDILLWNGHVGDWVDIDSNLVETDLVRETFEGYCTSLRYERAVELRDGSYEIPEDEIRELKKIFPTISAWDFNAWVIVNRLIVHLRWNINLTCYHLLVTILKP